ncbi:mitogen-activated protein kinase kinase kinase 20-like [Cicer arietinum]|uniref:Mitogen-activated protein kinase kinase kinase 17-like n=1 Tax=Cicer arietinum TaxID=3827 RepID=A0A1S2YYE8_CICAR|nr:mitogen-activated protein kinase kinase kinase 17-like [Cicer arietinum]
MNWVRGHSLGSGTFATVDLAIHTQHSVNFPSLTAVKSTYLYNSYSLLNEKHILDRLGSSPFIVKCFGHDQTLENGVNFYNIFLEYAAGGTLSDQLKNHGGKFPETLVRRYTRSIVKGLKHIHENGFVHCDVKLQNILVFDNDNVKISDFGLSKKKGLKQGEKWELRGTPMFMSPESVNDNVYESPADIWALGCTVMEMVTGEPAWNMSDNENIWLLLVRIGIGEELPLIPDELSDEGKDFLEKCFVKDPLKRWSAEMLLKHPFIFEDDETISSLETDVSNNERVLLEKELLDKSLSLSPSPTTQFDFPQWISSSVTTVSTMPPNLNESKFKHGFASPEERLRLLVTEQRPLDWSESDEWHFVRSN